MKNETHTYLQNVWEACWQMGAAAGLRPFHQITSSISRWHLLQPPHQIFSGALSLRQVGTSQITCRPVSHFKAKQQMSSLLFCGGVFSGLNQGRRGGGIIECISVLSTLPFYLGNNCADYLGNTSAFKENILKKFVWEIWETFFLFFYSRQMPSFGRRVFPVGGLMTLSWGS